MEQARLPDPFAIQADPALYVPRRATEEALDELERGLAGAPQGAVCFSGPPGIGKSLLLRVLAAELEERYRTAYLPYARLPAGGLWMCVATELGLEAGRDPKRAVRRLLGELAAARRGLLLEVDDASSLPAETLYDLLAFARSEANLRVLLTYSENESLPGPLPEGLAVVRLEAPMNRAETQDYVKARLAGSGAPRSLADRFDSATIARLHRESAGNPLRLHGLAVAVARGAAPSAAPGPAWSGTAPSREPAPAPPAPAREPEAPARAAPRPRRRVRASLTGPAWALAGVCVGLGLSLLLAEWRHVKAPAREPAPLAKRSAAPPAESDEIPVLPPPAALGAPALAGEPPAVGAPPPRLQKTVLPPPAAAPPPAAEPSPPPPAQAAASEPAGAPEVAGAPAERAAAPEAPAAAAPVSSEPAPGDSAKLAPPPDVAARPVAAPAAAPPAPAPRRAAPAPLAAGRLDVNSDTPVEVEIDGRPFGTPPLVGLRLSRGEHRVIARYGDGGAGLKTIYLADEDVSVTFR